MRQTLFTRASFTRISQSIYYHSTFTSPVWFLYPVSQPRHEVWECADTDRCHFWHHHWHEVGLVSVVPPEHYSMIGLVSKCDFCECVLILVVCPSARVDQAGVICKQEGIFRVNCMDCLDRTNVVQAAIARVVMEQQVWFSGFFLFMITYILEILIIKKKKKKVITIINIKDCILCVLFFLQLKKLGVMPPEQPLPLKCYRIYQVMWANNGDTISRQYAGTAALKVS